MPGQVAIINAIDAFTDSLVTVTFAHHAIHDGHLYHVGDVRSVNTTTQKWLITTPDSAAAAHMIIGAECTGEVALTVTEGADRTGTTPIIPINHNRTSTNAATVAIHLGATGGTTDGTTTVFAVRSGATGVGAKTIQGGGFRGDNEYILKPDTRYVVAAQTFADVYVTLELDWYERAPYKWLT